jgi:hypothetical protein
VRRDWVRQAILTPAHVSDKVPFLALVQGDEQTVYADRSPNDTWRDSGSDACPYTGGILDETGPAICHGTARLAGRRVIGAATPHKWKGPAGLPAGPLPGGPFRHAPAGSQESDPGLRA